MTEIAAIVGIYGAVDEAVQSAGEARARVSKLLPLYRDPELRWYGEFEAWLKRERARAGRFDTRHSEPLFPELRNALSELALFTPRCRMRARRLFAIAVAMRAFPEMRNPHSELGGLAVHALRALAPAEQDDRASKLCELLADEGLHASAPGASTRGPSAWWDHLITRALDAELISSVRGMRPRPCSGQLVYVPGIAGPVAALKTEFETEEVGFEAATKFIEPVNWPKCMPFFFCEMRPEGGGGGLLPGMHRYHEVVSTDCANKEAAAFSAETDLLFNFMWLPEGGNPEVALANYQLADGRPEIDDLIRVDEGTLVVAKAGPEETRRLRITTTKRIEFSYPFSSQALALIMCALGYADVAADLLCCAATHGAEAGTDFAGESPPLRAHGASIGPSPLQPACPGVGAPMCRTAHEMAGIWAEILREGATALGRGASEGQGRTRPFVRGRRAG